MKEVTIKLLTIEMNSTSTYTSVLSFEYPNKHAQYIVELVLIGNYFEIKFAKNFAKPPSSTPVGFGKHPLLSSKENFV